MFNFRLLKESILTGMFSSQYRLFFGDMNFKMDFAFE